MQELEQELVEVLEMVLVQGLVKVLALELVQVLGLAWGKELVLETLALRLCLSP